MKKQTLSALDVANYFIQVSSQDDEPDLTNLKLQKLLYFAQGKYLAEFDKPLFEDNVNLSALKDGSFTEELCLIC